MSTDFRQENGLPGAPWGFYFSHLNCDWTVVCDLVIDSTGIGHPGFLPFSEWQSLDLWRQHWLRHQSWWKQECLILQSVMRTVWPCAVHLRNLTVHTQVRALPRMHCRPCLVLATEQYGKSAKTILSNTPLWRSAFSQFILTQAKTTTLHWYWPPSPGYHHAGLTFFCLLLAFYGLFLHHLPSLCSSFNNNKQVSIISPSRTCREFTTCRWSCMAKVCDKLERTQILCHLEWEIVF